MKIRLQCLVFAVLIASACGEQRTAVADINNHASAGYGDPPTAPTAAAGGPGSTQEICPNQPTPAGWVIISMRSCAGCCGSPGQLVQMKTIEKIEGMQPGSTVEICPQPTPVGWVIISIANCAGCCGSPGNLVPKPTIKKVDGLPSGTTLEICPQSTPAGWVVVSTRKCAGCCNNPGNLTEMPTIKKL